MELTYPDYYCKGLHLRVNSLLQPRKGCGGRKIPGRSIICSAPYVSSEITVELKWACGKTMLLILPIIQVLVEALRRLRR